MTNFTKTSFRNNFFAILCTVLFSSTMLLSATAPALADTGKTQTSAVVASLA